MFDGGRDIEVDGFLGFFRKSFSKTVFVFVGDWRSMLQSPGGARVPVIRGRLWREIEMSALFAMSISVEVNTAVVPASVACPTEKSDLWREGMRCPGCRSGAGKGSNPFEAPRMTALLAMVTAIPLGVGCSSSRDALASAR